MIIQLILLLLLFLNFSFENIQKLSDQNFIIREFSKYINLKNIFINENNDQEMLEILIEVDPRILNKPKQFYITPLNDYCNKNENTKMYLLENNANVNDEIIKLKFIENLNNNYRKGIVICRLKKYIEFDYGNVLLTIEPLFRYPLYFEPKKEIKNNNREETKLTKLNMFLNKQKENLIEICIKFKEKGNYLIKLKSLNNRKYFGFFVKVLENKKEKCVSKIFENITLKEIKILNLCKLGIEICVKKIKKNLNEEEEEFVFKREMLSKNILENTNYFNLKLEPLIDDGNYFFEIEKGKIKDTKNNLINNLKLREIKKVCKNKFEELIGKRQKWFLFNDKYYLMNDCFIAEKLIEEN